MYPAYLSMPRAKSLMVAITTVPTFARSIAARELILVAHRLRTAGEPALCQSDKSLPYQFANVARP